VPANHATQIDVVLDRSALRSYHPPRRATAAICSFVIPGMKQRRKHLGMFLIQRDDLLQRLLLAVS
jgi:hypothetical protein